MSPDACCMRCCPALACIWQHDVDTCACYRGYAAYMTSESSHTYGSLLKVPLIRARVVVAALQVRRPGAHSR